MKYYCDLYLSKSLIKKQKEIIRKLEAKKFLINKFLIVLSDNEDEYLEIYNWTVLTQPLFNPNEMFVIGIADSYGDALQYITKLTQTVYEETKDGNVKDYIINKQQQYEESNK